jgi:hypothetical protein
VYAVLYLASCGGKARDERNEPVGAAGPDATPTHDDRTLTDVADAAPDPSADAAPDAGDDAAPIGDLDGADGAPEGSITCAPSQCTNDNPAADTCGPINGKCTYYVSCFAVAGVLRTGYGLCGVPCLSTGNGGYYCPTTAPPPTDAGACTYHAVSGTVSVTAIDPSPADAACPNDSIVSWTFSPAPGDDASIPPLYMGMPAGRGTRSCASPLGIDAGATFPETLQLVASGGCTPVIVEAGPSFLSCASGCQ